MSEGQPQEIPPILRDPVILFLSAVVNQKGDPRSVILLAHGVLELFVNGVVDARCKNAKRITSDSRGYPHSVRLIILHEIGALSDDEFRTLEWFRRLRNRAAHDPLFQLLPADLTNLREAYRDPAKINDICTDLVAVFWNCHIDDLLPKFAPTLHLVEKAGQGTLLRASRNTTAKTPRRKRPRG